MGFLTRCVRVVPNEPRFDPRATAKALMLQSAPLTPAANAYLAADCLRQDERKKYAIAKGKETRAAKQLKKEAEERANIQRALKHPRCTPLLHLTIRRTNPIQLRAQLAEATLAFWEFSDNFPKLLAVCRRFDFRAETRQRRNMKTAARLSSGESIWIKIEHKVVTLPSGKKDTVRTDPKWVKSKFYHTPSDLPIDPIRNRGGASSAVSNRIEVEA
jgi:hypothetical protein